MIVFDVEQNTPEWEALRKGIPTASGVTEIMSKGQGKKPSKTRASYMMKLLSERLLGSSDDSFTGNRHTERGHLLEPEARELYRFIYEEDPHPVGFIKTDDESFGVSPDSLVNDNGLLEIKTKLPYLHIPVLLEGVLPQEHEPQVQAQLFAAEREWCDFVSYWPGLPLAKIRVYRDEDRIKEIHQAIDQFNTELAELEQKVLEMA